MFTQLSKHLDLHNHNSQDIFIYLGSCIERFYITAFEQRHFVTILGHEIHITALDLWHCKEYLVY